MKKAALVLFALLCVSTAALAADNPPQGPWSVGPINAKSSSGIAYCSMKNTYANGNTLVFARDAAGSNSVAIDFGRKTLTAGGQYPVTLDVGMLTRQMNAIAATDAVLIVQLGIDNAFYDMLRRKAVLQASFESQSISFGLAGTADALDALTACADALNAGADAKQVNIALSPLPAENKAEPEKETFTIGKQALTSSLKDEVERLRAENRQLMLENQKISREIEAPVAEDPEVIRAKEEQKKLQAENKKLKTSLQQKKAAAREAPKKQEPAPKPPVKKGEDIMIKLFKAAEVPAQLSGMSGTARAYTWNEAGLSGGAVEQPLFPGQNLSQAASDYITRAQHDCRGDFAHKLGTVQRFKDTEAITGEVACLAPEGDQQIVDTAGAILFIADDEMSAAIILHGTPEHMETALAKRDSLAAKFSEIMVK